MRVIIVGRDKEIIESLSEKLKDNFQVLKAANTAEVQVYLKKGGIQFLIAEPAILLDYKLAHEVQKRCPMARLIALASNPSLLEMSDVLSSGIADYFPRAVECFDELLESLMAEHKRMLRWRRTFLSPEV